MRRRARPLAASAALIAALACGGSPAPVDDAPVVAPDDLSTSTLPVMRFDGRPGDRVVAAHDAALGDLVGGTAGLFLAAGGALTALADDPVLGLAATAPRTIVVATADGVSVFAGALEASPLSAALAGAAPRALAADPEGLWLSAGAGLYRYRFDDERLERLPGLGAPDALSAHAGTGQLVAGAARLIAPDGGAFRVTDLSAERALDAAFALGDGTVLGVAGGALLRRVPLDGGRVAWRPQALEPGGPPTLDVEAAGQDPVRGAVWIATSQALFRLDGPRVTRQPRPDGLGPAARLTVDELGAVWIDDGARLTRVGGDAAPVTWQGAISAFAEDNCARCHGGLGTARPLDDYETWTTEIDAILRALEEGRMPLDGAPLLGGTVDTVRRWKEDGLLF